MIHNPGATDPDYRTGVGLTGDGLACSHVMMAPAHQKLFLRQITTEDHNCRSSPGARDTRGGASLPGRL